MNARAMPISSRTAAERLSVCFWANSPRILEERSATVWAIFASSAASVWSAGCITHDAIRAGGALCLPGVVQVVQVGYRLSHGEEGLVGIERPPEEQGEQLARALRALAQRRSQLLEACPVVLFELRHALMRPAEGLAVRRQHEHVGGQLPVARDGLQE